jgi:hypothetical protein
VTDVSEVLTNSIIEAITIALMMETVSTFETTLIYFEHRYLTTLSEARNKKRRLKD